MAGNIKVKVRLRGDVAEVKSLVLHPMETGARKDAETGATAPVHHITELTFQNNGETVMTVHCSTAVSRDPYFSFSFSGAAAGDRFTVRWVDNTGDSDSTDITLG